MPDRDYFRRDKADGITAPNLALDCSLAEHVVRARGRRTRYTSVSLDLRSISRFGKASYRLLRDRLVEEGHRLIEHEDLLRHLRDTIRGRDRAERLRAVRGLRFVLQHKEGIADWRFDIAGIDRKDLLAWAAPKVREFFSRI